MSLLANAELPLLFINIGLGFIALPLIVIIEGMALKRGTPLVAWHRYGGAFLANLASTVTGIPLFFLLGIYAPPALAPSGHSLLDHNTLWAALALALIIPLWAASAYIESRVLCLIIVPAHERSTGFLTPEGRDELCNNITRACWRGNDYSYTLLAIFWTLVLISTLAK